MYKDIKYFEGLNALRFFAAYLVLLHHAESIRTSYRLFSLKEYSLFNNGGIAVSFFFVLSGFLITYLILREKENTQDLSVRKFYIRRILRIWPLYYLLVLLGTVIIPSLLHFINSPVEIPYSFGDVIMYYVFFAPFMVNLLFGHHLLEPLWSIGVEEIFYILWAPLFKFVKKNYLLLIISVIVIKVLLMLLVIQYFPNGNVYQILSWLQFEAMAIGGLGAYFIYNLKKDISGMVIFSKPFQLIVFTFIIARFTILKYLVEQSDIFEYLFTTPIFSILLMSLAFLWLILNISLNKRRLFHLNYRILNFLGEISYGIYMYHMLVIFSIVLFFGKILNSLGVVISTGLFYLTVTLSVIFVAWLSKKMFEDKFLKLKSHFQNIEKNR